MTQAEKLALTYDHSLGHFPVDLIQDERRLADCVVNAVTFPGSVGSSNSPKMLAPIVQAVAVLVVNLGANYDRGVVHVNLPTINPRSRVEPRFPFPPTNQ